MNIDPNQPAMTREQFEDKLLWDHEFERLGPNTLIYGDDVDTITVSIRPGVLIITNDGPHVVAGFRIIQLRDYSPDTYMWDGILQDVLALF